MKIKWHLTYFCILHWHIRSESAGQKALSLSAYKTVQRQISLIKSYELITQRKPESGMAHIWSVHFTSTSLPGSMGDSDSVPEDQPGCHDSTVCCHCRGCLGISNLFVRGFPRGSMLRLANATPNAGWAISRGSSDVW